MTLNEIVENIIFESHMVWARSGNKVVKKYRCTFGPRKGRVVSNSGQCSAPIDIKKRMTLKRTKAKKGSMMARKAKRTKKTNPTSKMAKALNQ
jgi:hypothetical protein